jgi:hypothetical protein
MPRLARLDAPGVLHHVMGRGIERKNIFCITIMGDGTSNNGVSLIV